MQVVYCSSDSYVSVCAVSITSLAKAYRGEKLVVHVVSTDMTIKNKTRLYQIAGLWNFTLYVVDFSNHLVDECTSLGLPRFRGGYEVYTTLFLSSCFPGLDRVIFIDADTIVLRDLSDVWELDLAGNLLAAVPDYGNYAEYSRSEEKKLLNKNVDYYNSGFLLMDLAAWRRHDIAEQLVTLCSDKFNIFDQSILNALVGHKTLRLPLNFNLTTCAHGVSFGVFTWLFSAIGSGISEEEYKNAQSHPAIVHFVGKFFERPWYKNGYSPYKKEYLELCEAALLAPDCEARGEESSVKFRLYYSLLMQLRRLGFFNLYAILRYYVVQRLISMYAGWR